MAENYFKKNNTLYSNSLPRKIVIDRILSFSHSLKTNKNVKRAIKMFIN